MTTKRFEFRNYLNDHEAVLWNNKNQIKRVPFTGRVTRLDIDAKYITTIDDIDIVRPIIKGILNEPPREDNVINIVSGMTAEFLKRPDCVAPDTIFPDFMIKNGRGYIEGVKRLITYNEEGLY